MAKLLNALVRSLALLWTLLITALIGNVIATNTNGSGSATRAINYTMFTAAWVWVASLWGLLAAFVAALTSGAVFLLALVLLDSFAVLFTFVAAVLLAAKLGTPDCGDTRGYGSGWIAFGSGDDEKRCREIQASTVFMWFLWATSVAGLVFSFREWRGDLGGFRRSSKPGMSQVHV